MSYYYHPVEVQTPRDAVLSLSRSEQQARLDDPARTVYTDLRTSPAVVVPAIDSLPDTHKLMQRAGVRMAFVSDPNGGIIGLVTAADLQGERPMQAAQARLVAHEDLSVAEVMTPTSRWTTLDVDHLRMGEVGHIVATFLATGVRYLVVTEVVTERSGMFNDVSRTVVCGLYSANRLERALGHPISEEMRSRSFADLHAALAHN